MENVIYILIGVGIIGLAYSVWKYFYINKKETGNERITEISERIAKGAISYIKTEYKILSIFVASLAVLLFFGGSAEENTNGYLALSYITGAGLSGLAAYLGLKITTKANVRTTNTAQNSFSEAFKLAFTGSSVSAILQVSFGILGLSILFILYDFLEFEGGMTEVLNVISGFLLGAATVSLFNGIGGRIYTKATDKAATQIADAEPGIPENNSMNPGAIADSVGDNISEVVSAGSSIFESFSASIVAAMILGAIYLGSDEILNKFQFGTILLPLALAATGIITSIIGIFFISMRKSTNPKKTINIGNYISLGLVVVCSYFIIKFMLPEQWLDPSSVKQIGHEFFGTYIKYWGVYLAAMSGLAAGFGVSKITEYYLRKGSKSVWSIIKKSRNGSNANVLGGISVGMKSTAIPILIISAALIISYFYAGGLYGIAIAAVGLTMNTGIQLTLNTFGPIVNNANDIAVMADIEPETIERTEYLNTIRNTTSISGKGFIIASAALTSIALFLAFVKQTNIENINLSDPKIIGGLLFGAMFPILISALVINSIGRVAKNIITEIKRQYSNIPLLKAALSIFIKYGGNTSLADENEIDILQDADGSAEYNKCIKTATNSSLRELIIPGILAVALPPLIGYLGGALMLGGFLIGVIIVGIIMSIFQSNSGSAWDSAKKMVEQGVVIDDITYGEGSELHEATITGDKVGDSLKDASGPSMNVILKLVTIVALVIAPSIAMNTDSEFEDYNSTGKVINIDDFDQAQSASETYKINSVR